MIKILLTDNVRLFINIPEPGHSIDMLLTEINIVNSQLILKKTKKK